MSLSTDQKLVFKGILFAWLLSALFIGTGVWLTKLNGWFDQAEALDILGFSFVIPAVSLAIGIGWAAKTRHGEITIDGSTPQAGTPLDLTLRYIRNTSEQIVLFVLSAVSLCAASLPVAKVLLPTLGIWFGLARLAFWIGYRKRPVFRATGFAATFHPTVVVLSISSLVLFSKLF